MRGLGAAKASATPAPTVSTSAWADDALIDALVGNGWLLDVASSDSALREVARPLTALLDLPRAPPLAQVQRWLQQLWKSPPPAPSTPPADLARTRDTFSLALRFCIAKHGGPVLDVATTGADADRLVTSWKRPQSHAAALAALPGLCLLLSHRPQRSTSGFTWSRFPPSGSSDAHPLLADSESKAPFVEGLPFGWLHVLTHAVDSAGVGGSLGSMAGGGGERASRLEAIDRGLVTLLRVPTLSDPAFELSSERVGKPSPMGADVAERLSLLLNFAHRGHDFANTMAVLGGGHALRLMLGGDADGG